MLAVCDKKGRVLGLKNRSLNSAAWYAYEPSSSFAALFVELFLLFAAAGVWGIFLGFDERWPLLAICYLFLVWALLSLLGLNITAKRLWAYALDRCSAP